MTLYAIENDDKIESLGGQEEVKGSEEEEGKDVGKILIENSTSWKKMYQLFFAYKKTEVDPTLTLF